MNALIAHCEFSVGVITPISSEFKERGRFKFFEEFELYWNDAMFKASLIDKFREILKTYMNALEFSQISIVMQQHKDAKYSLNTAVFKDEATFLYRLEIYLYVEQYLKNKPMFSN